MTFQVKIGKFSDDDSADITVDGRAVGWLERVKSERFASATSRARVSFVSHYSIMLTDDFADEQLRKHDFDSVKEAKLEVANAFERALKTLAAKSDHAVTAVAALTADTITDAEIHALRARLGSETYTGATDDAADCHVAIAAPVGSLRRVQARARCAEILNAKSRAVKE